MPSWVLIIAGGIVVVCLLLGALVDLRWIAVGLMVLLIGVPAVGAWLYFDLGMRSATAFNVLPHTVTVSEAGMDIAVVTKRVDERDKCDERDEEREVRITQLHFCQGEIKAPLVGLDAVMIPLATTPEGFIWLPYKFESETADDTEPDVTTTAAIIKFVKKNICLRVNIKNSDSVIKIKFGRPDI